MTTHDEKSDMLSPVPASASTVVPKIMEICANDGDEDAAEEGQEELVAEEIEASRALPTPVLLDKATVDHQNIDHLPFR